MSISNRKSNAIRAKKKSTGTNINKNNMIKKENKIDINAIVNNVRFG